MSGIGRNSISFDRIYLNVFLTLKSAANVMGVLRSILKYSYEFNSYRLKPRLHSLLRFCISLNKATGARTLRGKAEAEGTARKCQQPRSLSPYRVVCTPNVC